MTQFAFNFDSVRSTEARNDGMGRVEDNAPQLWKDVALDAVYQAARANRRFIVDAVWRYMPNDIHTHDLRAMGPVMRRAIKAGWIAPTTDYINSNRVTAHKNPRRIWQSLITEGVQP